MLVNPRVQLDRSRRRLADLYASWVDPLLTDRPLPHTLILGAQKAGTTSLYHALAQHPETMPSRTKEIHFFDLNYARGLGWYRFHFPGSASHPTARLRFESSPYYLFHPCVPKLVHKHLPDAKFIVLLRDPVARAYSHYWHEVTRGREPLSFADAVAAEPERLGDDERRLADGEISYSPAHHRHSYVARGDYASQLRRWFRWFPSERFLILESEALFEAPEAALGQVTEFLGLQRFADPVLERRNTGSYSDAIEPALTRELAARFADWNRKLPDLAGRNFRWLSG